MARVYRKSWSGLVRSMLTRFVLGTVLLAAVSAAPAAADGAWLDSQPAQPWNTPGMAVPGATPPETPIDLRMLERERVPETPEDEALAAAGWHLFAPLHAGWGVRVIQAAGSYDGMGRPWDYQAFVFVDGRFAGTLAPEPMDSRTDGALDRAALNSADTLLAEFRRYGPSDPLCCPSGGAAVQYRIERAEAGPVVVPVSVLPGDQSAPTAAPQPPTPARSLTIDTPVFGATVPSAFDVRGRGTVAPFESTLVYVVYDFEGHAIGRGPITVNGEMGQPFTFTATVSYSAEKAGPGWVVFLEPNAAGGPPFISVAIPVRLTAAAQ